MRTSKKGYGHILGCGYDGESQEIEESCHSKESDWGMERQAMILKDALEAYLGKHVSAKDVARFAEELKNRL